MSGSPRSLRMLESSTGIVYGMTSEMRTLAVIPYLLVPLGLAVILFAWRAWRNRYWGYLRRACYSTLSVAVVMVLGFLVRWNYLPPRW